MNLITLNDYTPGQIAAIIDTSIAIKQNPKDYAEILKDKALYMLFEKTSTRTSLGFGLGFSEMGGKYFFQKWDDSNFVVGDIKDEIRFVARNVDVVLARLKKHEDVQAMGDCSPVPIINGCCDRYHPTQAIADLVSMKETFGTFEKTLLYIGIWNNTFNSLLATLPRLGGKLIAFCPIVNEASISAEDVQEKARNTDRFEFYGPSELGGNEANSATLKRLALEADVIYTDTWVDMEFFHDPAYAGEMEARLKIMRPFAITPELMEGSSAKVMHDMPIHAGYEIERDVAETHMETILNQGENRRQAAKGIFMHLLGF